MWRNSARKQPACDPTLWRATKSDLTRQKARQSKWNCSEHLNQPETRDNHTNSPHAYDVLVTQSNTTPGTQFVGGAQNINVGQDSVEVDCISNFFSVFDLLFFGLCLVASNVVVIITNTLTFLLVCLWCGHTCLFFFFLMHF